MNYKATIEKIKSRRKQLGYTQKDMTELTGLSERTIRSIENGEGSTSIESFIKILDVLGMEISVHLKPMSHEKREGAVQ
jgi:transcriptional regulator with XRE-family HTH domain